VLLPRFPPLQSGAAFSSAAFSTPAFLLLPRFPVPRFQRPRRDRASRQLIVTLRSRPSNVTDTNRTSVCDFLLENNANLGLHPISHPFQIIDFDKGVLFVNALVLSNICEYRHITLKTIFWLPFRRRRCGSILNHFDVTGPQIYRFCKNNAKSRPLRRLRSLKVNNFCAIGKLVWDFLFLNNTNLHPL